ncbi:MAG TPA: LCP family protein [Candidatus Dormibacteraeota bacterium]|nr:LCP family protein [Candidatus Dormibacteraeota bacterium]
MDDYSVPRSNRPKPRPDLDGFFVSRSAANRLVLPDRSFPDSVQARRPSIERYRFGQLTVRPKAIVQQEQPIAIAQPKIKIDMALPEATASSHNHKLPLKANRLKQVRQWSLRAVVLVLVSVIGLGGLLLGQGYFKLHKVFRGGTVSAAALQVNTDPSLLKGEGDGRVNVLLLGRGGGNHDAPDLTDTMMLASLDPVNQKADLVSIPRDLWVNIAGFGDMKINAAWEMGKYKYLGRISSDMSNQQATTAGFNLVDQTVERVFGVPIDYNVLVDFQAFKQAVDTVGGITVNVPTDLWDPTMAWENNWNPILAKAGVQNFNGKRALLYVRSRETTSDFARTERQRVVMVALKQKVVSLGTLSNPLKLGGLMSAFGDNAQTDLSLNDASRLYSLFKNINGSDISSIGLADPPNNFVTTGAAGNQSIVQPRAGLFDYGDIQTYLRGVLKDGYLTRENAKITILNGTTEPGLATAKEAVLKSYGYNVTTVANAPSNGYTKTMIIDLTNGKDKYTKHYLEQRFGVSSTTQIPDSTIQPGQANFIIILGSDETTNSQN